MPAKTSKRKRAAASKRISMRQVAQRAGELVRREAPSLKMERHWGQPWFVGTDMVCLVGAFSRHVSVEFWRGSTIPDPDHLLEGTGKNLRLVKLRTLEEASSPKLGRLVRRAVALDRREPKRTR
ncbi:MAG: DUF1801 domain-containing protein [Thermoplasmata archaeon]